MSEQIQDLRELLVIHKARNPNPVISTKSILIFAFTWTLWFLTAYLIFRDHQALIYRPIVGTWALADLAKIAAVIVLLQLNILRPLQNPQKSSKFPLTSNSENLEDFVHE